MLIAFLNIRNSNHKHTCVEHIPNINFVFYPVKSDALTILQECPYKPSKNLNQLFQKEFVFASNVMWFFAPQAKEWSGGNRGEELEKSSKDRDIQPTGKDKRPWV